MAIFYTFVEYINCSANTKEKIARIDAIIEKLEDAELNGAANADIEEYSLDDGQTKIRTTYRDLANVEKTIQALYRRKQRLINNCIGYRYNLQDGNIKFP